MKKSLCLILLLITALAAAQPKPKLPDACELITSSQINTLLGTIVKREESTMPGLFCPHRSADNGVEVTVQYVDFNDPTTAEMMLTTNGNANKIEIANKTVTAGAYTAYEDFETAGKGANVMFGTDELHRPLVRFQFTLNKYVVTFDTAGIPAETVKKNLPEIHTIIKKNAGM